MSEGRPNRVQRHGPSGGTNLRRNDSGRL